MKDKLVPLLMANFLLFSCSISNKKINDRFIIYDNYILENNLTSVEEINTFKFQGWNSLDNYHIVLSSSHNKNYLITFSNFCNDINITLNIIVDQSINFRLNSYFDSIIVPNQYNIKCTIKTIHPLNKQQKNEVLSLSKPRK